MHDFLLFFITLNIYTFQLEKICIYTNKKHKIFVEKVLNNFFKNKHYPWYFEYNTI